MVQNTIAVTGTPGHGGFPPFQKDTFATQLFWLVISFVLLYALVAKIGLPRIRAILADRQRRIDDDFSEASHLEKRSEAALAAYHLSIADTRSNAEAVVRATREKLNTETSQSRGTLKAQLDAQLVEAEERIAAAKAGAMTNVRGIVIDSTRAIAERLIGAAPAPGAIAHSVDHVLMRGADANDQR